MTDRLKRKLCGSFPVTIYYEDTDSIGIVYHPNFLKFFERARTELIGIDLLKSLKREGIVFVVSKVELRFHTPAYHGDKLTILTELSFSRSPRMRAHQLAVRGEERIAEGHLDLAAINSSGRPTRLPQHILDRLPGDVA